MTSRTKKTLEPLHKFQSSVRDILRKELEGYKVEENHIALIEVRISSKAIDYAGEFYRSIKS